VPSPLQTLIHSSLGIHSLPRKQPLKHNVIDRDKVLLPPNWDSWGKIRVLREGFDVEGVSRGWSTDIEERSESVAGTRTDSINEQVPEYSQMRKEVDGAVAMYEGTIRNPGVELLSNLGSVPEAQTIDINCLDTQEFLANQLEVLSSIRSGTDSSGTDSKRDAFGLKPPHSRGDVSQMNNYIEEGRVSEHIGPVQFNMGGIQVDADDMLQKLKVLTSK
jgi:dynein light intermediate chain 1, cytosolic